MRWLYQQLESLVGEGSAAVFLTVLLATLMIKALTLFSDVKSRKSSYKMQQVQPEIEKLKKKYSNDPQKLNTEQRKLMKERGVSMFGGCLPMLFTLPLFFIFISAFRSWSNEQALRLVVEAEADSNKGTTTAVETMESYQFLWINNVWRPDNFMDSNTPVMSAETFYATYAGNIDNYFYTSEDPQLKETLTKWGFFDIPLATNTSSGGCACTGGGSVSDTSDPSYTEKYNTFVNNYNEKMAPVIAVNEGYNNGVGILAVIAGITTFLSQWIMQRNQPKQADGKQQGKFMMYLFPAMTMFFCWSYDSTFSLYWIFSNVIATAIGLVLNSWFKKKYGSTQENRVEVIQ